MTIANNFLTIQNELNNKLSTEWKEKGWNYPDAMFTEATEAYNHLNWEWWRATDRKIDWNQVKLEIVDVGHFLFSEVMSEHHEKVFEKHIKLYSERRDLKGLKGEINVGYLKNCIKRLISDILDYDSEKNVIHGEEDYDETEGKKMFFSQLLYSFFDVLSTLKLTLPDFYTLFVGKVCLNQLRWKNGYKKGIYNPSVDLKEDHCSEYYIKNWEGVEDNEWLSWVAKTKDPSSPTFKQELEESLDSKYKEVYAKAWDWVK